VSRAEVRVAGQVVGSIGRGLCVLVGVAHDDDADAADRLAAKVAKLRVFADDDGRMNRSVADVGGAVLVVSQFTLCGDTSRGNRPGFSAAARPEQAEPLVDRVVAVLRSAGLEVATGRFRAEMALELVNDGPVTLVLDT
jgi:D-tyrosyl-tRNA(Tyr) deacylase